MKLLFLSVCGKLNEPEETKYINLYLASLKKHVVPHFETKVILLTTYKIEDTECSLLRSRIKEFGLEDVVSVHTINDLELSEKALEIINSFDWYNRIGMHMNILFDYAKKNQFFNADWIFHIDTDIEFLEDFPTCLESINNMKKADSKIFICLSGDAWHTNVFYKGKEYLLQEAKRVNFYDEENIEHPSFYVNFIETERENDYRNNWQTPIFYPAQMKIRNDFVGMSKEAAEIFEFNWIPMYYPADLLHQREPFTEFWPQKAIRFDENGNGVINDMPKIHINYHMGGLLLYKFQSNQIPMIKIQLPGYSNMALHYSSGWFNGNFIERSAEVLNSKYDDTKEIWSKDYE